MELRPRTEVPGSFPGLTLDALRALQDAFPTGPPQRTVLAVEYLDTFDWRIFHAGGRLAALSALRRCPRKAGCGRCR